jgi:hypothetical protein
MVLMLQILTRTDLVFSLLCFFFIVTAITAFNVAGGLTRPSGAYVLFFSTMTVIIGILAKVIFLEPGQSHLLVPNATMATYLAAMIGMLVAVYLSRRISRRTGYLQDLLSESNLRSASIGCVIVGIAISLSIDAVLYSQTRTVFTPVASAISQINRFPDLAIILGVTYEIRSSGGRRSLNIPVLIASGYILLMGAIIGYSKQALFTPLVCWLVVAAALRYRIRPMQAIAAGLILVFSVIYMVPYCQYGRTYRSATNTFRQNLSNSVELLSNLREVRRRNQEDDAGIDVQEGLRYYDQPHGLLDRLQMLSIDDGLHVVTDENGPSGLAVAGSYVLNAIPHVIWKSKPDIKTANTYGHELGLLAPEDDTTSVSVSPVGESYRMAKWVGILVLLPIVWLVLFVVMDSLCGDPRRSPWGILVLVMFAHLANEGAIGGQIWMLTFGLFGIVFVSFTAAYVLPLIGSIVVPPRRKEFVVRAARASLSR